MKLLRMLPASLTGLALLSGVLAFLPVRRPPRSADLASPYWTSITARYKLRRPRCLAPMWMWAGIVDLLVTGLVKDGSYSVIERKALDKILAEQNFSNSSRADPSSAAKIGKLLGVDAIIEGSITEFGNETKKTNLGGGGDGSSA